MTDDQICAVYLRKIYVTTRITIKDVIYYSRHIVYDMAVNREMASKKIHGRTTHRSGRCTEGHLSNETKTKEGRKENLNKTEWKNKSLFP